MVIKVINNTSDLTDLLPFGVKFLDDNNKIAIIAVRSKKELEPEEVLQKAAELIFFLRCRWDAGTLYCREYGNVEVSQDPQANFYKLEVRMNNI